MGAEREEQLVRALQGIMQVLGPEATCECDGCRYEQNEAIRIMESVGIAYKGRKKPRKGHDPVAEARGNETVEMDALGQMIMLPEGDIDE